MRMIWTRIGNMRVKDGNPFKLILVQKSPFTTCWTAFADSLYFLTRKMEEKEIAAQIGKTPEMQIIFLIRNKDFIKNGT